MRMIDADHLKKWILQRWEKAYSKEELPTIEILDQIDRELTCDVVRCKDCKHYMQTDTMHHRGWCWRWSHFTAIERYCSESALKGDTEKTK